MGITIEGRKEAGIIELDGLNTYFACLVSFVQSKILRYKLANFKEIRALLLKGLDGSKYTEQRAKNQKGERGRAARKSRKRVQRFQCK